jgi:hypothetical protein
LPLRIPQNPVGMIYLSTEAMTSSQVRESVAAATRYTPGEFVELLADHVPDHYRHAIRHFGLLGPRSKSHTFGAIFVQLGQQRRPRPLHLSWAHSIEREYGINPLLDSQGERMHLIARRSSDPVVVADT